jgi:ATP adenylyltransferase
MTNATPADCPFCRKNQLLKSPVLAESDGAYLIENLFFPGNYLIVPSDHIESLTDLPDRWWEDVKTLIPYISNDVSDYNLSFNIGKHAGQTIPHLHLWIIPRTAGEAASGKGMVGLINAQNA